MGDNKHRDGSVMKIFFAILFFISCSLLPIAYCPSHSLSFAQDQKQQQGPLDKERLGIIKSDIQKEIQYNEKLKKDIEDARKGMDEAAQQRLLKVSKIYEAMAPEEAAKTLEKLDEDTAAAILGNLKPRKAGAILGQMDSEKAASISKKLVVKAPAPR
ncbi:MAG: hypothetical protein HQL09_00565 [Nitrospirae bacterium]|nr:hypothetical protein [Nitrospirota bacterium]